MAGSAPAAWELLPVLPSASFWVLGFRAGASGSWDRDEDPGATARTCSGPQSDPASQKSSSEFPFSTAVLISRGRRRALGWIPARIMTLGLVLLLQMRAVSLRVSPGVLRGRAARLARRMCGVL